MGADHQRYAIIYHDAHLRIGSSIALTQALKFLRICRRIRAAQSENTVENSGLQIIHQTAVKIMSPDDTHHLQNLLRNFDAEALGEGDVTAGANVLAAMAISLANIQRPGSGLVTRDGQGIAVGTSMLASGSHSSSLISEKIISGLAMRQNNLTSRFCQRRTRETGKGSDNASVPHAASSDLAANWAETVMQQLCRPGAISDQQANECWGAILQIPPQTDLSYLRDHPVVFATGTKPAELVGQLERCHLGRPLIHVGLDSSADFARFEHLCPAVMDGRMTVGTLAETIRGTVTVTDPNEVLGEAVRSAQSSARWATRMLWLVDGNAGPDFGGGDEDESSVPMGGIERRFEIAMGLAWGRRISDRVSDPLVLEHEFSESQARWIRFLKRTEPAFLGITGTARNLFVTLLFGLQQMVDAARIPVGFRMPVEQVEAFARFLIHRMVNFRGALLHADQNYRRGLLERAIFHKLEDGPQCARMLCRRFHRLPIQQCNEVLLELEIAGRVTQSAGVWRIAPAHAELASPRAEHLVLEA